MPDGYEQRLADVERDVDALRERQLAEQWDARLARERAATQARLRLRELQDRQTQSEHRERNAPRARRTASLPPSETAAPPPAAVDLGRFDLADLRITHL